MINNILYIGISFRILVLKIIKTKGFYLRYLLSQVT